MANLTLWSRRLAKTVVAAAIGPVLPRRAPLVIGYHRVVPDFEAARRTMMPSMLVSRGMLERQLDCLGRFYRFVSVDDLGAAGTDRPRRGKPAAAVTFDDGYRDVYEHAFPLLRRKGIPAAVFVVTDFAGTDRPLLNDRVYRLAAHLLPRWRHPAKEAAQRLTTLGVSGEQVHAIASATVTPIAFTRALVTGLTYDALTRVADRLEADAQGDLPLPDGALPASWDMLREMRRAGMTIGSHTARHIRMTNEARVLQEGETAASRARIERELGEPVDQFAYPDGDFNSASVRVVDTAGYRWAYTTCRHRDPYHSSLTVPRLMLWEHSSIDMSGRLSAHILRCQSRGVLAGSRACSYVAHA
jgi:peptidoglycan/xylan/chitin deacetylase (PgdA/CDA1 family)